MIHYVKRAKNWHQSLILTLQPGGVNSSKFTFSYD